MPAINIPNLDVNAIGDGLKDKQNYEMILDTLQRYRKELNFYLMNLDFDNMPVVSNEIEGINSRLVDADGKFSLIEQDLDSITLAVGNAQGDISSLQITASGIQTQVTNQSGQISTINQTVSGIQTTVASLNTDVGSFYSQITQLDNEISSIVSFTDVTGNQIASRINQSATTITLEADKIDLLGITEVSDRLYVGGRDYNGRIILASNFTNGGIDFDGESIEISAMSGVYCSSLIQDGYVITDDILESELESIGGIMAYSTSRRCYIDATSSGIVVRDRYGDTLGSLLYDA